MTTSWTRSLRVRLVLWLSGLCAVSAIALLIGVRLYGIHAADRAFDRILNASALAIAEQVFVRDGQVAVDLPYAALDMLGFARNDSVYYRVIGPQGRTITGYADLPPPAQTASPETPLFFNAAYRGEATRFVVLGRLLAEPELSGWATIQVGQTRNARSALASAMAWSATLPIIAFMLIILALVWYGVRRGLTPLQRVEAELEQRQPTDLSPLNVNAPREIEGLVGAMNHFMAQLQTTLAQMQRFIGDASHQIRTPLASLKAQAELARDTADPQQLQHYLDRIEHNAAVTTRLANQLLSNAVITHRANTRHRSAIDLIDVIHQAVHDAVPLADGRIDDINMMIDCKTAPLQGDPVALREALRNLLENALQHAGDHGAIDIRLHANTNSYLCSVIDHGPGIPARERGRVLQRFQRGAGARGPGSGLGLAIVHEVVVRHGGTLTLTAASDGGLCATIRLPAGSTA